ncbi:hypothetical protein GCM10009837_50020 [Streptomyces durmitorensis]|uniref:Uncharacterized protein n=1 Tax=Streptomyces durmitorensis TaxID=319947 RepID=A0ABY4Q7E2_9ACTN|nr:hypothetical protein [Streptomyces durmitorensis]UQT61982.1 hypothetical protein M4V62_43415 [Streptomyces durmitorensis]
MRITIEGASEAFEHKLLALLAEHRDELAVTVDTAWNVQRATTFLSTLNPGARLFVRLVIDAGGQIDAAVLREKLDRGLRGPTVALSNALKRGVRHGWWPEGTEAPVAVVYGGPHSPAWRQADSYELTEGNLPVFREALARLDDARRKRDHLGPLTPGTAAAPEDDLAVTGNWEAGDVPSGLDSPPPGWGDTEDVPRALLDEDGR